MKLIVVILFFISGSFSCRKNELSMSAPEQTAKKYYYLALGDSYTIGEKVPPRDIFPNQVYAMVKNDSVDLQTPRIIAKTGWTTDELETGIVAANNADPLRSAYDLVSLLIGVNNQYRGRSVENYKPEFEELLKKAIAYAGNKAERVVVLSIPDWGVTPFADGRDRAQIAREIDAYNAANKQIAKQFHVHYIDITPWTREAATDISLLAPDGLHPSGKEYKRWAERIAILIKQLIP
jgi:lysophospholipase L1-like esterase